jgi:molecular chaperone GrpE
MTREQFKEYICQQIDLMDGSEFQEFSSFLNGNSREENIAEELIVIKGEFKKLTKLVQSMGQKIDETKAIRDREELEPFIEFDAFLKNSKDAIDSLPQASFFGKKKVNRSIRSLQNGFGSIESQYRKILEQIGLKKGAKIGDRFDSNLHEAVEVIENKKIEDGTIIEILEDGFLFQHKVINYAKVKVNRWTS